MSDSKASNPFNSTFPGFAGFGPMMEQMEAFKRLWSSMDGSSRLVPTLDVDELDKRITDLKAVEQWLNLNLSMLRGSIQALEIQRGTLEAVKAFGAAFQSAPGWPGAGFGSGAAFEPGSPLGQTAPASDAKATSTAPSADPASGTAPGIDPSGWWTLLQNNFQQIAQAAMASAAAASASKASASASKSDRPSSQKTRGSTPRKAAAKTSSGGSSSRPAPRKSTIGQ